MKKFAYIYYYLFLFILFIVGLFTGKLKINAAETSVPIDIAKYRISYQNFITLTDTTTGFTNGGTSTSIDETKEALFAYYSYLYFNNSTLSAGRTYNILLTYTFSPVDNSWFNYITSRPDYLTWTVYGNATASATNASEELISTYHVSISPICDTCSRFRVNIVLVPAVDIKFVGLKMDMSKNKCTRHDCIPSFHSWNYFNFPTGSSYQKVTYNTDGTINAINNQNIIIENNFNEVNNNINNINDSINNDDVDNPSSSISDMENLLPSNGVITQLITLPITLYQKVLNSINGTCQSFNLGSLYNTNLIIPCIDISNYLGSTIWNSIDLIISGVFVLVIARKMIKAFEGFTSMKDGDVIND